MRKAAVFLALVAARGVAVAQASAAPAIFDRLIVDYQLAAGLKLVETRTGELRWNASIVLPYLKQLSIPSLNAAGEATARNWTLTGPNGAVKKIMPAKPKRAGNVLYWPLPEVEAGSVLRFETEQPVDIEKRAGGVWWFADHMYIPLPVKYGTLRLQLTSTFQGSADLRDTAGHSWALNSQTPTDGQNHFTISSFKTWKELAAWTANLCDSRGPDSSTSPPTVADVHRRIEATIGSVQVLPLELACRPIDAVAGSGVANPLEIARLFARMGLEAESFLSGPDMLPSQPVNPTLVTSILVRVKIGSESLWFDTSRPLADGSLDLVAVGRPALSLRTGEWMTFESDKASVLSAVMDAALTGKGALRATARFSAEGSYGSVLRQSFQANSGRLSTFGSFLTPAIQTLRMQGSVTSDNSDDVSRPFTATLPIYEPDYVLPIERLGTRKLSALQLARAPKPLPDGKLLLGPRGVMREEITVTLSDAFRVVDPNVNINEDFPFAAYRSRALLTAGKLRVTRELEIKQSTPDDAMASQQAALWKRIAADQDRTFLFRRLKAVDAAQWIDSLPVQQLNPMGFKALEQREYESARRLLIRATQANANDRAAWNNLGRAYSALRRDTDALEAFQTQLRVNPDDSYAYNNMGLIYARQARWEQAIEQYRKQLGVHPGDLFAARNLPRALMRAHHWGEVFDSVLKGLKSQPGNTSFPVYQAVARVCLQGRDSASALEQLTGIVNDGPESASNNAAYYLAECEKQLPLAESLSKRALERQSQRARIEDSARAGSALALQTTLGTYLDTYGWVLLKLGRAAEAVTMLRASTWLSHSAETCAHFALALEQTGAHEEAARWAREAANLAPGFLDKMLAPLKSRTADARPISDADGWQELQTAVDAVIPSANPLYFFAISNPDGGVRYARPLDTNDPESRSTLQVVQSLKLPTVEVMGKPIAACHLIKLTRSAEGKVTLARSIGPTAILLASELSPDDFPLPAPASPAAPADPAQD